jgi:hypothetical protein
MGGSEVHFYYMQARKLGMKEFIVRVPKEYFYLDKDVCCPNVFHDMCKLLRCKDHDIAQVTLLPCKLLQLCIIVGT